MGCRLANVSMAPPKKRKSSNAGDGQTNISTFFSKTLESSKNTDGEEGRGTAYFYAINAAY